MAQSRFALAAACAVAFALSIASIRARSGSAHEPHAANAGRVAAPAPSTLSIAGPVRPVVALQEPSPRARELPRSLQGTEIDGGLDLGPEGHLVLGPRVIALFDYFLSATGEESDEVIRARLDAHLRAHLVEPALGEGLALLGDYFRYRDASRALTVADGAPAEERLAAVRGLRQTHFGDAADALFGEEERDAERALRRLDGAEGAERPEALSDAEARVTSVLRLRAEEKALRAEGADEAVIHDNRVSRFGPEGAERLDALDRRRASFKARIEAFRTERAQRCGEGLDAARCESALLANTFDAREQIRVRTLLAALISGVVIPESRKPSWPRRGRGSSPTASAVGTRADLSRTRPCVAPPTATPTPKS